jgi:hypothetical protein
MVRRFSGLLFNPTISFGVIQAIVTVSVNFLLVLIDATLKEDAQNSFIPSKNSLAHRPYKLCE